jgi:hypothetical protein
VTLIYADDRVDLTEEATQRYVLATAAGVPLITFGRPDEYGVAWLAEEPAGWDAPEVDLPLDRKADGHGAFSGEQTYEDRPLAVQGSAEAPSIAEAHRARKRLVSALTSTVRSGGYLLWTHLDDDPARSLWVQLDGKPNVAVDGRWIDYAFVLVAPDPIKFGAWVTYGPVRLPSTDAEPGRSYTAGNRTYDLGATAATRARTYTAGATGATVVRVPNDGEEPAPATFTITGPVPRPRVTVESVGGIEFVALGFDLGALDVAVIDSDLGTVEVNGVNRYDAFLAGSTFPTIPAGGAEVRLRSETGGTDQAAGLVIGTAPRWT